MKVEEEEEEADPEWDDAGLVAPLKTNSAGIH